MSTKTTADGLIGYLHDKRNDKAVMAILKRALAFPPGTYIPQYAYVARFLTAVNELPVFLVSSLFALHPLEAENSNLGDSFKKLPESPSVELRFKGLLQCRQEELAVQLRTAVSLLASKEIAVDYAELYQAVSNWEHPERFIQKRWAKAFWAPKAESEQELTNTQQ